MSRSFPRSTRLLTLALLLAAGAGPLRAGPFTGVVAFGDSLTDTGNLALATGGFLGPLVPPATPADYFLGRQRSNGPLWVEHLAGFLGVPVPAPSLTGGTNNAFIGGTTGSAFATPLVPPLAAQIAGYLATHAVNPTDLFALWGGANDIFNGQADPTVPVANLAAGITALADAGARTFLVNNLPLLGDTPFGFTLPPADRAGLNALTAGFNALLAARLDQLEAGLGVSIHLNDVAGLLQNAQANPAAFGYTNATGPALYQGVPGGQGYLFFDFVHPTTAAHRQIAQTALAALRVPEPGTLALWSIVLSLAGLRLRKGRRR